MSKLKIIGESETSFGWCINTYNRCAHGCVYCYGKGKHITSAQWIQASLRRAEYFKDLNHDLNELKQDSMLKASIQDIFVSSITDCYQPLEQIHRVTRETIKLLKAHELPFTVLTKSAKVLEDLDLFKGYPKCRVGITITTLDERYRKRIEPHTSTTDEKITALETLRKNDILTYCSVEPITSEASDPTAIVKRLGGVVGLFEFGIWNEKYPIPKLAYNEPFLMEELDRVMTYCDSHDIHYCHAGHSKEKILAVGLPFVPSLTVTEQIANMKARCLVV